MINFVEPDFNEKIPMNALDKCFYVVSDTEHYNFMWSVTQNTTQITCIFLNLFC